MHHQPLHKSHTDSDRSPLTAPTHSAHQSNSFASLCTSSTMRFIRKFAVMCALLGAAAAALTTASPAQSHPLTAAASKVPLSIASTVRKSREQHVRDWCNWAYAVKGNKKYNVMVINNGRWTNVRGIQYRGSFTWTDALFRKTRFQVFVFRSGQFVKNGDGGYKNWCFIGRFKRSGFDGKVVNFW